MEKTNFLIPMCGRSQRFKDQGITTPKPLIEVGGKRIIDWAFESIDPNQFNLIFLVREEETELHDALAQKFQFNNPLIIKVSEETKGAVDTCLRATPVINTHVPLSIFTLDVYFEPRYDPECFVTESGAYADGGILTFSSTSKNYSYSKVSNDGLVTEVAEKRVISNNASAGIYYFRSGSLFVKYAEDMVNNYKGEVHIAPLYNYLIKDSWSVVTQPVDLIYIMGTPQEKAFIESSLVDTSLPLGLMCDHSGFQTKERFRVILDDMGYHYIDFGAYNDKQSDYPTFVKLVIEALHNKQISYGFGFCRSGQGVNINANHLGARAALIDDTYTAKYAVKHNAANFFSIPEKISTEELEIMLDVIMGNRFEGGRHQDRLMMIEG